LPFAVAFQRFETVASNRAQSRSVAAAFRRSSRRIRRVFDGAEFLAASALEDRFGFRASERANQKSINWLSI
jgi:hypothetical protein